MYYLRLCYQCCCLLVISMVLHTSQTRAQDVSLGSDFNTWGPWSPWSACSLKDCYPELSSRSRSKTCSNDIPRNLTQGTSSCNGAQKQYKMCSQKHCNNSMKDNRRLECDRQRHIPYRGRRYHWVPYINPSKNCRVSCKSSRYGFYVDHNRLQKDGTPCDDGTGQDSVCMHGKCQVVGCDGVIGSGLRKDHCGVCGGHNDACRIIAGIYTRRHLKYGYNLITRIPKGSCHINITELARSRNYLVLNLEDGTGVINSDRRMMKHPGTYYAAGTQFQYNKYAGAGCPGECLYAEGPITEDIEIQVLSYRRNPGIKYVFTIPKDKIDSVLNSFTPTSPTRHSGHRHGNRTGHHSNRNNNNRHNNNNNNNNNNSPALTRRIDHEKSPEYVSPEIDNTRQALQSGDQNGYSTQDAINRYRNGYNQNDNERKTFSKNNIDSKPKPTSRTPSRPQWNSEFNYESTRNQINSDRYGRRYGTRYRPSVGAQVGGQTYNRQYPVAGNRYQPDYGNAITNKKPKLTIANTIDEINFHWTISGFTECSRTCGGGTQDTKVVCMKRKSNVIVTDENCDPKKKKVQTVLCNKTPCPPDWNLGPWSVCSTSCGSGIQTRKVECHRRFSENISDPVSARMCDLLRKPATSQQCEVRPCAEWRTSNWTKCSVECGIGQIDRSVDCVNTAGDVVADVQCSGYKPDSSRSCDMGTCAKGWFQTSWSSECSTECGPGYHTRMVYCSAEDGSSLPESKCGEKPSTKKSCKKNRPCGGFWFEGPWTQCSATCGSAVQTRDVLCLKKLDSNLFTVVGEENCKENPKPTTKKQCPSLPECPPEWFMTKWSECSKSCNTGIKQRDVKCLDSELTPSSRCEPRDKPSLRRTCNTQNCDMPQLDEDPGCKDKWNQCHLVAQARLCPYKYYKSQCCHSCALHTLKHTNAKKDHTTVKGS